jgi:hypothetical protein
MRVTIVHDNHGDPEVHRAGCRDLLKKGRRSDLLYSIEAASQVEVSADFWCDIIGDQADPDSDEGHQLAEDYVGSMRFLPCTKGLNYK